MPNPLRIGLAYDLALGTITGQAEAARIVAAAVASGTAKGMKEGTTGVQKQLSTAYGNAIVSAEKLGAKERKDALQAEFKTRNDEIRRIQAEADRHLEGVEKRRLKIEAKVAEYADRADSDRTKKRWAGRKKQITDEIAASDKATDDKIRKEQRALDSAIRKQADAMSESVQLLDEGIERAGKSLGDKAQSAGDMFGNAVQGALNAGDLDISGMIKGAGGGLKNMAPDLMAGGSKMAASKSGMVAGLGKAAMALGAAAGAIAGVAAGIAALVAVFLMASRQAKDFNKAILEGASAADFMSGTMAQFSGSLNRSLTEIRGAALGVGQDFRVGTEEILKLAGAMNAAGVTFREQKELFGDYGTGMRKMIGWTQTFGVGAGEVAEMVNKMTRDMGLGLEDITGGFDAIFAGAQRSGMAVKDFYAAISEATSGMALYNFRLEDTVGLMLALIETLGEDLAKQYSGGLVGKYKEMGFTDRRKALKAAGGMGGKIIAGQATRQVETFENLFDKGQNSRAKGVLLAEKLMDAEGNIDTKKLGNLRGRELGRIQNVLADLPDGVGDAISQRLGGLAELQRGVGGNQGQQAAALANLDQAGTLAMDMSAAFAVLGEQGIGKMEGLNRDTFETVTGISGGNFEAMQEIYNRQAARLQTRYDKEGKAKGKPAKQATLSAVADEIAKGGLLLSDEDRKALMKDDRPEMEKIAQSQLEATVGIGQMIKNVIANLLEGANAWLEAIASLFGEDVTPEQRQAQRQEMYGTAAVDMDQILSQATAQRELRRKSGAAPEELETLDQQLAWLAESQTALNEATRTGANLTPEQYEIMGKGMGMGPGALDEMMSQYRYREPGLSEDSGLVGDLWGERKADLAPEYGGVIDYDGGENFPAPISRWMTRGAGLASGNLTSAREGKQAFGDHTMGLDDLGFAPPLASWSSYGYNSPPDPGVVARVDAAEADREGTRESFDYYTWMSGISEGIKKGTYDPEHPDADALGFVTDFAYDMAEAMADGPLADGPEWWEQNADGTWAVVTEVEDLVGEVEALDATTAEGAANIVDAIYDMAEDERRDLLSATTGLDVDENTSYADVEAEINKMPDDWEKRQAWASLRGAGLRDFIYQGNYPGRGRITRISGKEQFAAFEEGGAISSATKGLNVTIQNLTIYESEDPRKTLAMVEQGIRAAMPTGTV